MIYLSSLLTQWDKLWETLLRKLERIATTLVLQISKSEMTLKYYIYYYCRIHIIYIFK